LLFLGGASCEKSKAATDTGAIKAADEASRANDPKVIDTTPVPGIDVSKFPEKGQKLFFKLVDSFSSPCGKAHSLRTSIKEDPSCKRAPFAAKYLAAMIEDEIPEDDVRKLFAAKYKDAHEAHSFKLDDVQHAGSPDAPIKIVEFFDYGCPACVAFKPIMDEVIEENGATTVVYYKMFPLVDLHPNSMSAAQAALAAAKQGKFKEMHDTLFEHAPEQTRENVMQYAADLHLDMAKFEADYDAAEPAVRADMAEGEAAGVNGTPTIFFNGTQYEGPAHPRYFKYWIDEDLAVNR
jgi:protein-disulfide isomerase